MQRIPNVLLTALGALAGILAATGHHSQGLLLALLALGACAIARIAPLDGTEE